MDSATHRRFFIVLRVALLLLCVWLGWNLFIWRFECLTMAGLAGTLHAGKEFRAGQKRIYQLAPNGGLHLIEEKAEYELWAWPYNTAGGAAARGAAQAFVDAHNRRIEHLMSTENPGGDNNIEGPEHDGKNGDMNK